MDNGKRRMAWRARRWRSIWQLFQDRSGATAIEYGLIAGGISIAIIVVIFAIGSQVDGLMTSIGELIGVNL